MRTTSDYSSNKRERSTTNALYPMSMHNSMSKRAKTMPAITENEKKPHEDTEEADFKKGLLHGLHSVCPFQ